MAAVARIHRGKGPSIEVDVAEDVAVQVDPRALDELLGNVLDNAARHGGDLVFDVSAMGGLLVVVRLPAA